VWILEWWDELRQDLSFALRQMRRSPGMTSLIVAMLALGIGANTAVFSVVNAVVLRPLPFQEPERLVRFHEQTPQGDRFSVSAPNFLDSAGRTGRWRRSPRCRSLRGSSR
jgi:hypothetical protein